MRDRKRRRVGKQEAASTAEDLTVAVLPAKEAPLLPPPLEEEVEEFFAILRRMKFAAKCLKKGSEGEQWNPAAGDGSGNRAESGGGLDLNAIPEAEGNIIH